MENDVSLADIRKEASLKKSCHEHGVKYIGPNESSNRDRCNKMEKAIKKVKLENKTDAEREQRLNSKVKGEMLRVKNLTDAEREQMLNSKEKAEKLREKNLTDDEREQILNCKVETKKLRVKIS